jgi:hypothetical protein
MPRTAAQNTYTAFTENCDAAAVIEVLEKAPNREAVAAVHNALSNVDAKPTAFYNLLKSLIAHRDNTSYMAGGKEYGNPDGSLPVDKAIVSMQPGLSYASLNTLAAAYADKGAALFPVKESNGNGSETPSGDAAAPSTPVTSASGPAPVDPILMDTVKALQERFAAEDASAPVTGRAFLETLWEATPEEERNRRVNSIARAFVEARESASRRGELRTMIDTLSAALKEDGAVDQSMDIWTYIYNRALPTAAQSESYDQIKSNLKNAYRFDPDAATFRDWESSLSAQAAAFVEMFGKDLGLTVEAVTAKSALKRTRETLDSILSGMVTAQNRFNEWETRNLRSATPPPPVLEKIAHADLPEAFRSSLPDFAWDALTADAQRSLLAQRSIVEVDGTWTLAADRKDDKDGSGK